MNDILEPLGISYSVNIVTGIGELSHTRCVELVQRAIASGRPVRILYVSDFDPAGISMPVAVARKIEFAIQAVAAEVDVQVRPIALTYEQCVDYRLKGFRSRPASIAPMLLRSVSVASTWLSGQLN